MTCAAAAWSNMQGTSICSAEKLLRPFSHMVAPKMPEAAAPECSTRLKVLRPKCSRVSRK